jgi:hypothetical protein
MGGNVRCEIILIDETHPQSRRANRVPDPPSERFPRA